MKDETFTKTLRVRVKDNHVEFLRRQAAEVNFVWNYVNDLSFKHTKRTGKFFSAYDLDKYTRGSTKEGLSIHSQSVQAIQEEYVVRRKQFKKLRLRWRKSKGTGRSLGWIPFKKSAIRYKSGQVWYCGNPIGLWDSYGLADYELGSGSFSEDARGRWYFNTTIKFKQRKHTGTGSVGIDLGLKDTATTSDGQKLEGREFRKLEDSLAKSQRARTKKKTRGIHAKIRNKRRDAQQKFTTGLVRSNAAIFVGDVSSKKLIKTRMAKSVNDAAWYQLKNMLEYKSRWAGVIYEVVNEAYSTQTCSSCGAISDASPKGRSGLGIREWTCSDCGTTHDRDMNAALNILAAGHCRLAGGISAV
jgi:IS605 OrfB family transposase